jgi:hypothetical protein
MPHAIDAAVSPKLARTATLSLPALETINVGQKRQVALALDSKTPLSLAVVTLRFDPKVVKVNTISAGTLFSSGNGKAPSVTQSIDPSGVCIISVSTLNGTVPMVGNGTLLLIEVEGIAPGDALLNLEKQTMHLVATDARDVVLEVKQGRTAVKP